MPNFKHFQRTMEKALVELQDDMQVLKKPWAPFMATAALHFLLATSQFRRYLDGEVEGLLALPIVLCAIGGILDNLRLYYGSKYGEDGLCTSVTNIRYVFRMAALPLLFIPLSSMVGEMTTLWFLGVVGRVASVAFVAHGFNEFVIQVAGHYVTVSEHGVTRHTIDPKMRNTSIRLPSVVVTVLGLIGGLAALKTHDASFTLLVQVFCLLGRFAAPVYPQYAIALSRVMEAGFLATLVHLQGLVY